MANISDGIEWAGRRFPDKAAIVGDDGSRLTYRELDESANRIGRFLRDTWGLERGDRVGILAGNSLRFLEAFYGIIRAGCVAVPLNDRWRRDELEACLANCLPALILADESGGRRLAGDGLNADLGVPAIDLGSFSIASSALAAHPLGDRPGSDDFFYIGYTSGSTGKPKGVLRRHGSWLDSYLAATIEFGSGRENRFLAPGALFYSLSLFAVTHTLFLGGTSYIMSTFDPRKMLDLVERERVTTICMAPSLYEAVLNVKGTNRQNLGSVRTLICAGSGWPRAEEAKRRLLALFPSAGLYEYYGAAELSFVSVNPPEEQMRRPRSAGRPFLGVRIQVRGEDGRPVGPKEVGVLCAQSSYGFEGYYGDLARTATVLQGGWMTVGDLAYTDEEGYLYIVGRRDNVAIVAGMNVNVEEVEEVLNSHPRIALAAVFGVEDPRRGQALVALIQRRAGASVDPAELRAYCASRLESHKRPRRLRFVDAIPLTDSGKVSRPELPRLYASVPSPLAGSPPARARPSR